MSHNIAMFSYRPFALGKKNEFIHGGNGYSVLIFQKEGFSRTVDIDAFFSDIEKVDFPTLSTLDRIILYAGRLKDKDLEIYREFIDRHSIKYTNILFVICDCCLASKKEFFEKYGFQYINGGSDCSGAKTMKQIMINFLEHGTIEI